MVYEFEQNFEPCALSIAASKQEEEKYDDGSVSLPSTLFTWSHGQQKQQQKKINSSSLSLVSTTSFQNDATLLDGLHTFMKVNDNNNNNMIALKIPFNSETYTNTKDLEEKQNEDHDSNRGFQRDMLGKVSYTDDKYVVRFLSSPFSLTAEYCIQRHRRKQTRLKRKTESEKRKEEKKKRKKERNKKSPSSATGAEATTEASLFQYFAVDTPAIDKSAIFYPSEQATCVENDIPKKKNCFLTQTSLDYQHLQKHEASTRLTMADQRNETFSKTRSRKTENVRVFVGRRRRCRRTTKCQKQIYVQSISSINSHETKLPSDDIKEMVSSIERQMNRQKKFKNNKNIIVVNYRPVFVNSNQQQPPKKNKKSVSKLKPEVKPILTDDDFSSATHYSRRESSTTVSSYDDSLLRTISTSSHHHHSVSVDVPDVEDPLEFIEIMYQQLFTEDGRLRSDTESAAITNCVKQIVTNSRRNSLSATYPNGSLLSPMKHTNFDAEILQRKATLVNSSCHYDFNENDDPFSSIEPDDKTSTSVQVKNQQPLVITDSNVLKRNTDKHCKRPGSTKSHHSIELSVDRRKPDVRSFRISIDDTGSDELDTFSDLETVQSNNNITIQLSRSIDDDSRHLSSGYQSMDRSIKLFDQQKPIILRSYSENDLLRSLNMNQSKTEPLQYCLNCIRSSNVAVIPPIDPSSPSTISNIVKRIQQPIGNILMKYVNFIFISKNVLLLPLFIFFIRQRSMHIGYGY